MSLGEPANSLFMVVREYQPLFARLGLTDCGAVYSHPDIQVWRSIPERENATLDALGDDGRPIRLHIKRYRAVKGIYTYKPPAEVEAEGINRLKLAGIPTVELVAWGKQEDGQSFLITRDLDGYSPADKLIAGGTAFDRLLGPTAQLAARLHRANLHHRDLYLCHFFARPAGSGFDLALIDCGRVKKLPGWPFGRRWLVKDLAQFWYSCITSGVDENQRIQWLKHYCQAAGRMDWIKLQKAIEKKSDWIARHDRKLRLAQPDRNISLPNG